MTTRLVGGRVRRNEDNRLLQGRGCFVDDVNPRGVLHAAGVRSPHACARIVRIDATRARALPGVHLVLTASDLGDLNEPGPLLIPHPGLTHPRTQRPLAVDRVRYVGELVAFVVAEDRYLAEDAVDLIEVEYEGGPAVIDLEHALDPAAPRVHEDVPGNRAARVVQTVGDLEDAFRRAARVLRERLTIERSCGSPIEARGVVAEWDARGGTLRVWSSTQAPPPATSRPPALPVTSPAPSRRPTHARRPPLPPHTRPGARPRAGAGRRRGGWGRGGWRRSAPSGRGANPTRRTTQLNNSTAS